MAVFTWWVRRRAGSTLAVLMDVLGAIVLIPLGAMVVEVCGWIWEAHMHPSVYDPSIPFPPSLYEKSCCRKGTDLETDASTDNCLERCDPIEEDGGQRRIP
jgi:hypothetical protein